MPARTTAAPERRAPGAGVREVSKVTLRAWWNQILLDLGGSVAQRAILVWGVIGILIAWTVLGIVSLLASPVVIRPDAELTSTLGQQLVLVGFSLGPVIVAMLLTFAPPRSNLQEIMAPLPIRRRTVILGTDLPLIVIAVVSLFAVLGPIVVSSVRLMPFSPGMLTCLNIAGGGLCGIAISWLLFRGVGRVCVSIIGFPVALARSFAGLACIGVSLIVLGASDLGSVERAPTPVRWILLTPTSSLDWVQSLGTIAALVFGASVIAWLSTNIPEAAESSSAYIVGWGRRFATFGPLNVWRTELMQWIRHPLVISTETLMLLTVVLCVIFIPGRNNAWLLLAPLLVIASTTGSAVFAWGVNRRSLWFYTINGVTESRIYWAKLGCAAVIATAMVSITLGFVLIKIPQTSSMLSTILPLCLLGFSASFLAGMVFPVDQEQTMTSALALLATLILTLGFGFLLEQFNFLPMGARAVIATLTGLSVLVCSYAYARGVKKISLFSI